MRLPKLLASCFITSALGLGLIATSAPASAQSGFGTIKGRLVWGGADVPPPVQLKADKDAAVCAKAPLFSHRLEIDPKTKGVAEAFAYLVKPNGKNPEAEKALLAKEPIVMLDQINCEFVPYSTAVMKGQKFEFKSSDPVGHNARYSGFSAGTTNVALAPKGSFITTLAPEKRPYTVNCDIHPWMNAWIMVFDHPFFAVTRKDGSFEITGVPAGPQKLVLWQEAVGYVEGSAAGRAIEIKPGETLDLGEIKLDPAKVKKK